MGIAVLGPWFIQLTTFNRGIKDFFNVYSHLFHSLHTRPSTADRPGCSPSTRWPCREKTTKKGNAVCVVRDFDRRCKYNVNTMFHIPVKDIVVFLCSRADCFMSDFVDISPLFLRISASYLSCHGGVSFECCNTYLLTTVLSFLRFMAHKTTSWNSDLAWEPPRLLVNRASWPIVMIPPADRALRSSILSENLLTRSVDDKVDSPFRAVIRRKLTKAFLH